MATDILGGVPSPQPPALAWEQPLLPIPTGPRIPPKPRVAADIQAIAARYLAGESIRAISQSEKVSYQTIRNRLLQAEVQIRPRQPAAERRTVDSVGRRIWRPAGSCAECDQPRDAQGVIGHAGGCRYSGHAEMGRLYGTRRVS